MAPPGTADSEHAASTPGYIIPPPSFKPGGKEFAAPPLPNVLERALNYKVERAKEVGIDPADLARAESVGLSTESDTTSVTRVGAVSDTSGIESADNTIQDDHTPKKSREQRVKRKRKKKKKKRAAHSRENGTEQKSQNGEEQQEEEEDQVDVTYVSGPTIEDMADPLYRQFADIFQMFRVGDPTATGSSSSQPPDPATSKQPDTSSAAEAAKQLKKVPKQVDADDSDDDDDDDDDETEKSDKPKLSNKKLKQLSRMSIAQLKQQVSRPDMVEMHDVTSKDPLLLMTLKGTRNSVPVPRHWCFKRKYLQGKRGFEKPPFELPEFIQRTGIMEMRQALQEKEDQKNLKARMREKVRPKMGKIDIDYQKLHDAFFKWQTKPRMSIHGDLYYEGKEFEIKLKEKKPGEMSDELRTALGMPTGPSCNRIPPPWLIAMQRYGPPPSYPNLRIAGLNAPIPDGCSFGYHAGGWGKPPVDENGRPLYGDVFGTRLQDDADQAEAGDVDRTLWGELESDSEESESEEESGEEGAEQANVDESGLITPAEGMITPSGVTSVPTGLETPETIELRKKKIESEIEGGETPQQQLYHVLAERRHDRVAGTGMMASTHTYDLPPPTAAAAVGPGRKAPAAGTPGSGDGVELALDPSELELVDTDAMAQRLEERLRETQLEKEDLSDMVAEHAAKQKNKRKRQQNQDDKKSKKHKG